MAGVKGKSGGARANSGGRRAGAGRKPKSAKAALPPAVVESEVAATASAPAGDLPTADQKTPLTYLLEVVNDSKADPALRVRAALGAAPYVHGKTTEIGKKEVKNAAAKTAGSGRFAPAAAPLKLVGKK